MSKQDPEEIIASLRGTIQVQQKQIERLQNAGSLARLTGIADKLCGLPKIVQCLVFQQEKGGDVHIGPEPGTSGAKRYAWKRTTEFRCFVSTSDKLHADRTAPTLREAVVDAFDVVKINLPPTLNLD